MQASTLLLPLVMAVTLGPLIPAGKPVLSQEQAGELVDFRRDVQPLFEEHCLKCHREDKHKAGLRLDAKSAAMAGSYFGTEPVILPGNPADSVLFQRVSSADEDERMPPRGDGLSVEKIALLRRWIEEGAPWPDDDQVVEIEKHWAYLTPTPPQLPNPANDSWARNEIDRFVLARLEQEGLEPSPEADRATLLRRLSLDLIGLPPTVDELEAFLADDSPAAYEEAVDRLLASPHYGERQARAWLDLARYADTHGYEKDGRRTMWRYRDWVIDAFNADMGFDRFTIEQLAGDLLPEATLEQRIATGFHRNTMINAEGGVDPEEYRVAAVLDRVNTTASVWLGSTLACAQCHTHKYDPFSQKEYFKLFAYFNSTADIGPGVAPRIDAPTREEAAAEARAKQELSDLAKITGTFTPELADELRDFEAEQRAKSVHWSTLRPTSFTASGGTTLALLNDASLLAVQGKSAKDTYELTVALPPEELTHLRLDVLRHESLASGGPGLPDHGNFVLSEFELRLPATETADEQAVPIATALADYSQKGSPAWPAVGSIDGDPGTGWAIGGAVDQPHRLVLALESPLDGARHPSVKIRMVQDFGGMHLIGRFQLSAASTTSKVDVPIRPDLDELITGVEARTEEQQLRLDFWFLGVAPSLAPARERIAELEARRRPPTALVMVELDTPRETRVLERGSFLSPGDTVVPGVPAALGTLPEDARPDRLGLARWLVHPENPLTARVAANRLWQQIFGRGLVATPEDFGSQGQTPSHPELLDWLALQMQADGWSTKESLRRIVLSATYRQSSVTSEELKRKDPQNRLLARGARYRVEAEMVRDIALVASGLIADEIGGPSVFPPQPEGIWKSTYSADRWKTARDDDRFRRGLYTFWRRTSPYPSLMTFGATSRELACVRRSDSNTPLQALTLLNDPAFVEMAVALGASVAQRADADDRGSLEHAFQRCTSRRPTKDELDVLSELLNAQRTHFKERPDDAAKLIASEADLGTEGLDPVELAAWTVVANVLLNLDETITRG